MDAVRALILKEAKERKLSLSAVSKKLGMNHAYMQQFIHRGIPDKLPEEVREKLAALLHVSEIKLGAKPHRAIPLDEGFAEPDDTFAEEVNQATLRTHRRELAPGEIPELDVVGGLGSGRIGTEIVVDGNIVDNVRATWTVPVDYLRTELRSREIDVEIISVDGDSMLPTLTPGDRVMVNHRQKTLSPDGIYAIHDGLGVAIKRIEVVHGTDPIRVRIISDNPKHTTQEQVAEDVTVIGRVICRVSRM